LKAAKKELEAAQARLEADEEAAAARVSSGQARNGEPRIWMGSRVGRKAVERRVEANDGKEAGGKNGGRDHEVGASFAPDDFEIRLGYAFGEDEKQTPVSIAGKSEVYTEAYLGWNLIRFGDGGEAERPPIRGSFNFEVGTGWSTDKEVDDIHARVFVGPALVLGVPVKYKEKDYPIVEVVARLGAVRAEIPSLVSKSSRELEIEHERPRFHGSWGVGMDIDFNVPVPNDLGYLMLRGRLNSNFDPNPWTVTLGYTVPLSKLFDGFTGDSE
jgi:hypothetical protein